MPWVGANGYLIVGSCHSHCPSSPILSWSYRIGISLAGLTLTVSDDPALCIALLGSAAAYGAEPQAEKPNIILNHTER